MTARLKKPSRRRGAGMTEYIVLVGLLAIFMIVAVTKFSNQINVTFVGTGGAANEIGLETSYGRGTTNGQKSKDNKYVWTVDAQHPGGYWKAI